MRRSLSLPVLAALLLSAISLTREVLTWPPRPGRSEGAPPPGPQFVDVTARAGLSGFHNTQGSERKDYILETIGGGCAFLDYDDDGWLDILLVAGSSRSRYREGGDPMLALYRNHGDGTFTDVTASSGLIRKGWGMGVTVADYDNDGWVDIFVTGYGNSFLFRNNGDGTFTDVTSRAGLASGAGGWATSAAFFDYDLDGYLDLYICRYIEFDLDDPPEKSADDPRCLFKGVPVMCGPRGLEAQSDLLYRNQGDGTFTEVTDKAGIGHHRKHYGLGVVSGDFDNDGYPDLYVANDGQPNLLFRNRGDGTFSEEALSAGVSLSEDGLEQAGMGVDFGDYNNDGWLDIVVTNFSHETFELYRNRRGVFDNTTWPSGVGQPSWILLGWGVKFFDYDNDGWLDLFMGNGHVYPEVDSFEMGSSYRQPPLLLRNLRDGRFEEVRGRAGEALARPYAVRGVAIGDYDNDGDLDILMNQIDGPPLLFRNDGGDAGNWLQIELRGSRSNRDAIGARVRLTAGELVLVRELSGGGSYASSNDPRLHFGLDQLSRIDRIDIRWPRRGDGSEPFYQQTLEGIEVNQLLRLDEPAHP